MGRPKQVRPYDREKRIEAILKIIEQNKLDKQTYAIIINSL